eukprot:1309311-Ditylum_brightwellii.AAC.1
MDIMCKAKGHAPGPLKLMESLRAEIRQITWMNLRSVLLPSASMQADMGVHFQIEAYLHHHMHTLQTHHVKGHQTGSNLDWEAMLNNRADALATDTLDQLTTQNKKG